MRFKKIASNLKKDFDMNSIKSCVFYHSQFESCVQEEHTSLSFLLYRLISITLLLSSLGYSVVCQPDLFHIFLTNWSFTLQTLYALLSFLLIIYMKGNFLMRLFRRKFHHVHPESSVGVVNGTYELNASKSSWGAVGDDEARINMENDVVGVQQNCSTATVVLSTGGDSSLRSNDDTSVNNNNNINNSYSPNVLEKLIWILMNITHVLPHIVVVGYWMFVYKYDPDQPSCERFKSHFILHGLTSVLSLIDSFVVAVPVRKTHCLFLSLVLLVYVTFSFIYEVAGGSYRGDNEYIYSFLNWRHKALTATAICIFGILISPIAHYVMCWRAHLLKLKLVSWFKANRK